MTAEISSNHNVEDQKALVTGAASGIGRAIALPGGLNQPVWGRGCGHASQFGEVLSISTNGSTLRAHARSVNGAK